MAGRNIRNRSVNLIEVRGIGSRGENHPLPEKADDDPYPYIGTVQEAINSYVTPSSSGRSSPTLDAQYESFLSTSNGWTTGNSTERSSLFSWTDDEFDKRAARTVRRMFDEIDCTLFEDTKTVSQQLAQECKDWKTRFPHLRILGLQMLTPMDAGYQLIPQAMRPSVLQDVGENEMAVCGTSDTQELLIQGYHVVATEAPSIDVSLQSRTTSPNHQYSHLEEEIFEADGCVEEYLAYDKMGDDEGFEQKKYHAPRRRRLGFPPITPNACLQDTIACQVFDSVWSEVSHWLQALLKKYLERRITDSDERAMESQDVLGLIPVLGPFDPLESPPPSRGFDQVKLHPMQSTARLNTAPANTTTDLDGLMMIYPKYLHSRDKAINPLIDDALSNNRPGSSTYLPRPRTANKVQRQFKKLQPPLKNAERAKTPMDDFNILAIGKKFPKGKLPEHKWKTGSASPPHHMTSLSPGGYQWTRNSVLPPIETVHENSPIGTKPVRGLSGRFSHNRISSAAADEISRRPYNKMANPESRPNTTHTFRSETPFGFNRRSSTPQSIQVPYNTSVFRPSNPTPGNNNSFKAGIHGVRVGIGTSTSHMEVGQPPFFKVS